MPIPQDLRDGNQHQMYCYGLDVTGGNANSLLSGSPKSFKFNAPIGYLGGVSADGIADGWSLDPDAASQSNVIHFYIDGQAGQVPLAGQIVANEPRPDVNQVTGYPGNHGFKFPIPAQYRNNQPHRIYAYGIDLTGDQSKLLSDSPKTFTLPPIIQSVGFELIATDSPPLDINPNPGSGRRIFPDANVPNENVDRRKVRVKAKISGNLSGQRVYFRSFDLDDPSSDYAPIDTNGSAGNDNNGNVDGTVNTRAGLLSVPQDSIGCEPSQYGVSCPTDSNGEAVVEFTVTMQPGDNFAVAASVIENELNAVNVNGIQLATRSGQNVPLRCGGEPVCRSSMLTVWRRLHIEVDSMGAASGNKTEGTLSTAGKQGVGEVTLVVNTNTGQPLEPLQFENGRMIIGTRSFTVVRNDSTSVTIQNPSIFSTAGGEVFTLYDDDDFNDDDPLLNGDEGDNVPEPDLSLLQPTDSACPDEISAANCNVFAPAYIRPVYDLQDFLDEVTFSANVDDFSILSIRQFNFENRATQASQTFWTIYLLGGYQYTVYADGDPDSLPVAAESGNLSVYGVADSVGATIFTELGRAREYERMNRENMTGFPRWQDRPVTRKHTMAHEVGHLFDGGHFDIDVEFNNAGLMSPSENRVRGVFSDVTLDKIRKKVIP
jgi:hypothetical protein